MCWIRVTLPKGILFPTIITNIKQKRLSLSMKFNKIILIKIIEGKQNLNSLIKHMQYMFFFSSFDLIPGYSRHQIFWHSEDYKLKIIQLEENIVLVINLCKKKN